MKFSRVFIEAGFVQLRQQEPVITGYIMENINLPNGIPPKQHEGQSVLVKLGEHDSPYYEWRFSNGRKYEDRESPEDILMYINSCKLSVGKKKHCILLIINEEACQIGGNGDIVGYLDEN